MFIKTTTEKAVFYNHDPELNMKTHLPVRESPACKYNVRVTFIEVTSSHTARVTT